MKIALLYNKTKQATIDMTHDLAKYLYAREIEIMTCDNSPGVPLDKLDKMDFSSCDAGIVLGGDGTLLAAVRALSPCGVPLFGVNMGRVGFLASVETADVYSAVDRLLEGDYSMRERLIIKATVGRDDESSSSEYTAFNDFVVETGAYSRAITFDLDIDSQPINSYNADGVIVSTPTGSTGYSLSAGGPILMDDLDITLITPVCPHTFFSRPIVAKAESIVDILCRSNASLTADGQFRVLLKKGGKVSISAADHKAKIIEFNKNDYFERIKNKLYRI